MAKQKICEGYTSATYQEVCAALRQRLGAKKHYAWKQWENPVVIFHRQGKYFYLLGILAVVLLIVTPACSQVKNPIPFGLYRGMSEGSPDGTPAFRSGWKAGCESGLSANGTLYYKTMHNFAYDPRMLNDDEYHNAWRLGFRHCRWYVAEWTR